MKTISIAAVAATIAFLGQSVNAQTTTDDARALAAQGTEAQQRELLSTPPKLEPVAIGDYRAEAHNATRVAQWQAHQDQIRAYSAGIRSAPIAGTSTDAVRAEAHRQSVEARLASDAARTGSTLAQQ